MTDNVRASQLSELGSGGAPKGESSSPDIGAFTVLKECPSSASNKEAALIDHRPPPRSRRRRTSPEDQAVLEAEFQRNPKPNRATRTEIVSRVTLGEKEVQIWFQNRRQIARRKSSVPFTPGNSPTVFDDKSITSQGPTEHSTHKPQVQRTKSVDYGNGVSKGASVRQTDGRGDICSDAKQVKTVCKSVAAAEDETNHKYMAKQTGQSSINDNPTQDNCSASKESSQNSVLGSGESTATQEMSNASISNSSSVARPQSSAGLPPLLIKRQSSSLRLSTSSDGKAQIVIDSGSSPASPSGVALQNLMRPQQPLQRSQSEVVSQRSDTPTFSDLMPVPRRLAPSRSRDARTWEFYCDSDARNALTIQAENEQKGKAETTIGLIRSSSSGRNTALQATSTVGPVKRKSATGKSHSRPKLARTESSLARLQGMSSNVILKSEDLETSTKKGSPVPMLVVDGSGDLSDKENWIPGTRRRHVRSPRPESEMRARSTLGENSEIPSHSNSLEGHLERDVGRQCRQNGSPTGKENEEPQDAEVAAFMGETTAPRVAEDLDCVQQLLSLSQGAWS